jgi:two-component system, cell cycle response regulator
MGTIKEATKATRVLLIEDNTGDARLIEEELKDVPEVPLALSHVSQLQDAMDYLEKNEVDLVLSDLSLPDSPGKETFRVLQSRIPNIPVVVLTGFDNESMALDAVREGAQDYLIKGQVDGRMLTRTILYAIERHRSQATLRHLSLTDELSQLYNRRGFMELGHQALRVAQRAKSNAVLFYIDLDGLKQINDTFGHPAGDRAISGASEVLRHTFRQADIVARIGGDEFAVLAAEDQEAGYELLISRLKGNLAQYNLKNPADFKIELSLGLARFDAEHPISITELMANADRDLYKNRSRVRGFAYRPRRALKRHALWLLLLLLLLGFAGLYAWLYGWANRPFDLGSWTPARRTAAAVVAPAPKPTPSPRITAPVAAWRSSTPPDVTLHRELIPKDIKINRFTYEKALHQPGDTFSFDIVGSGFTDSFQQSLSVYSGSPHVQVRNLRLVTINQIHGEMVIQSAAPTQYVFPHVMIQDTPVFQATTPFAIIRYREVLDVVFSKVDADGKGGTFRVYTHLDEALANRIVVRSNTTGVDVSALNIRLPYVAEGSVRVNHSVPRGAYPLSVWVGQENIYQKDGLVKVIGANIGTNGYIQKISPVDAFARPGDTFAIRIEGRGFVPEDVEGLLVHAPHCAPSPLQFISADRLQAFLTLNADAPLGLYDAAVYKKDELLLSHKEVFSVVGPNWVSHMKVFPQARVGQRTTLQIIGRDFSEGFAQSITIESDEPGLHIPKPIRIDAGQLHIEMDVDGQVRPGTYILRILSDGQPIKMAKTPVLVVNP